MSKSKANGRRDMLKVLERYRRYVSDNDAALYWKYTQFLEAINAVPSYKDAPNAWQIYAHSSIFREYLYVDAYDYLLAMLTKNYQRGTYHLMTGTCKIRVHLWTDEFEVSFVP